jgi:hypothetical protein
MYKIKDKRFHKLIWKTVTENRDFFLNMYSDEDLSGYPSDRTKCGYCVGELYNFIEKKQYDTKQAFDFVLLMSKKAKESKDIVHS